MQKTDTTSNNVVKPASQSDSDSLLSKVYLGQPQRAGYYAFRSQTEIVEQEYPDQLGLGHKVAAHLFE